MEKIKGKPSSLTSIAFNTGVVTERARVVKILAGKLEEVSGGVFNAKGVLTDLIAEINEEDN
jgi:hypothetical protein